MVKKNETTTTKRTMSDEAKAKISRAVSGIVKLSDEQKEQVKKVFAEDDAKKIEKLEELIAYRTLFELTGDAKYAPKNKANAKKQQLDFLLFS